jgi:hypothetical protein
LKDWDEGLNVAREAKNAAASGTHFQVEGNQIILVVIH